MSKHLFLGGHLHGQHKELSDAIEMLCMPIPRNDPIELPASAEYIVEPLRTEVYERLTVCHPNGRREYVYILRNLSPHHAVQCMLDDAQTLASMQTILNNRIAESIQLHETIRQLRQELDEVTKQLNSIPPT